MNHEGAKGMKSDRNELLKLIGDFVKNQPDPIKTET
jgi:hypothetical protein